MEPNACAPGGFFPGSNKHAEVVEAHQRQTAQRAAQHAFEAGIVFNHQAGAGVVHARLFYALLRLQPGDRGFRKILLPAQRRQMQPDAAGDEVPNREFHCAGPDPSTPQPLTRIGARFRMALACACSLMHFDEMIDRENGERDPNRRRRGRSDFEHGQVR